MQVQSFLGYDPNLANAVDGSEFGMGYRPLHYAAYGGFLEICLALYEAGARPLVTGDNGVTALFLAAQTGKSDVVGFLLDLVSKLVPRILHATFLRLVLSVVAMKVDERLRRSYAT